MAMKLVIVGGVAGGATAAARARRLSEDAEIVLVERGSEISFANCGLPYHIGGEIAQRDSLLVQTKAGFVKRFAVDVRTRTEAKRIDRTAKTVWLKDIESGREYSESYDVLLLSPGAAPVRPPIAGSEHPAIFALRNLDDMDRIKNALAQGAKSSLVVGGGFIGLEMAENLRRRELEVTVVELLPQVMAPLDQEIAQALHEELAQNGVKLLLSTGVLSFRDKEGRVQAELSNGGTMEADLVVLAVGVRPDTRLALEAGLQTAANGAIIVDEHMQTADPGIYAVGDAVQVRDPVLGAEAFVPLAGPANRQARVAVDHIFGREAKYRGTQGTSVVRVFRLTAASTGVTEKVLKKRSVPYRKVYLHRTQHAGYFPGAQQMLIKLLFAPEDGRVLGAQIVGRDGVDKRIDVLATAVFAGLTVGDLEKLELAYAPQYGSAKDPVNIAGNVASNLLSGDETFVYAEDLDERRRADWFILDVREQSEYESSHIAGAVNIPLGELRKRHAEIPKDKPIACYCGVGQRAYYATRILRSAGFQPANVAGGIATYNLVHPPCHLPPGLSVTDGRAKAVAVDEKMRAPSIGMGCCAVQSSGDALVEELDLRGLQCPGPLARLSEFAKTAKPAARVRIVAGDIGFEADLRAWCGRFGHRVDRVQVQAGEFEAWVTIAGSGDLPLNQRGGQRDLSRKKTIVVFSGDLDKVLAAFVLANAAVDLGDEVTLFFTFWGLNALRRAEGIRVQKSIVDSMFGAMMPRGAERLSLSKMNMLGMGTAMMRRVMRKKKVDDLPTLMSRAQSKGVKLIACSMSMEVMGLKREELIDGVGVGGAAAYLTSASEAGVNLFI